MQPLTPPTLPFEEESPSLAVGALADSWRQQVELARLHLTKAQKRMKKWADTRRWPLESRIHPVVHVSMLKPYDPDPNKPSRGESSRAPTLMFQYETRH
ncbi:hypothetical protein V2J09_004806 [Rumex salicifolius]